jgi:hypothetical protein
MTEDEPDKVLVGLRISPEDRDELKAAGKLAGRSLPNEILYRLQAFRAPAIGVEHAIGDLAALIARRVEGELASYWFAPTTRGDVRTASNDYLPQLLAATRDAMTIALNALGAADEWIGGTEFPIATGVTWDLPAKIKKPSTTDDSAEGKILARIGAALGLQSSSEQPKRKGK